MVASFLLTKVGKLVLVINASKTPVESRNIEKRKLSPYKKARTFGEYCDGAAAKESKQLFTKNTGLCEHESGCIGADACPVLEG